MPGSLHLHRNGKESIAENGDGAVIRYDRSWGQQQECGSSGSGSEARPMLYSNLECCPSPSKLTLSQGAALVSVAANVGAGTMTPVSFAKEVTPVDQRAVDEEPKYGAVEGHGVQPFYGNGEQSSKQRGTAESIMKDQTNELVAHPFQYRPASQENDASDGQKRIAFEDPTPPAEGLKRKQKPFKWTCDPCQVITPSQRNLLEHQASKRHRRLAKLKARNKPGEATPGSPLLRLHRNRNESMAENGNAPQLADDGDREPAQSTRWACQGCDAKFNSASSLKEHLAGSLHRENTEAILAKFSSSYGRKDGGGPGMSKYYYCKACNVHCTGDTMLASHLVGKKHRRKMPEGC